MPLAIQVLIVVTLMFAVFARWYLCLHPLLVCLIDNLVTVIPLIRNQVLGPNAVYQIACMRAIRLGSCCNNRSERHTMRIHGQVYLGVDPPFVRPIA